MRGTASRRQSKRPLPKQRPRLTSSRSLPHQVDPYPEGWYPADDERPPVPIMGGAVPSTAGEETVVSASGETTVIQTVCVPCGSGSGSYVTSYTTSYRTSYSGSGSGSFRFGSGSCPVGGYGLELI